MTGTNVTLSLDKICLRAKRFLDSIFISIASALTKQWIDDWKKIITIQIGLIQHDSEVDLYTTTGEKI